MEQSVPAQTLLDNSSAMLLHKQHAGLIHLVVSYESARKEIRSKLLAEMWSTSKWWAHIKCKVIQGMYPGHCDIRKKDCLMEEVWVNTTNYKRKVQWWKKWKYIPMFHYMQVPQFHDLFLSLIDICKLLDLLRGDEDEQNHLNGKMTKSISEALHIFNHSTTMQRCGSIRPFFRTNTDIVHIYIRSCVTSSSFVIWICEWDVFPLTWRLTHTMSHKQHTICLEFRFVI